MSGNGKPQRIKAEHIADVAAQGVARAMQARELQELDVSEIDQVSGGVGATQPVIATHMKLPPWFIYGLIRNPDFRLNQDLVNGQMVNVKLQGPGG